jgi:two-component system response regulator LytT
MIRIAIFEDEAIAKERIQALLMSLDVEIEIVAIISSIREGREFFAQKKHIDLAFFDIHLEDGLSFALLDEKNIQFPIIFVTAYDQYALDAFNYHSIGYLLKPLQKNDLAKAIDKYSNIATLDTQLLNKIRSSFLTQKHSYKARFTIKYGTKIRIIPVATIACFYSKSKGTYLHTYSDDICLLDDSLEAVYSLLDPSLYFKVNRKYIVRIEAIKSLTQYSNSRQKVVLSCQLAEEIIVAREKVKEFKKWIDK